MQPRPVGVAGGLGVFPKPISSPFLARKGVRGMVDSVIKHSHSPYKLVNFRLRGPAVQPDSRDTKPYGAEPGMYHE